jgi:beta-glucosidase
MPPRNNSLRLALVLAAASSAASAASAAARSSLLAGRGAAPAASSDAKPLYKQAGAPIPARVADLVGRMTVDELIAAVAHKDGGTADEIKSAYGNTSLGGVKITFAEGATALEVVRARNDLQSFFVQNSRLNIPLSFAQEGLHSGGDYGTVFPEPLLTACSWNDSLALAIGQVLGSEARASGVDNTWSPVVNMWVDDRFGRYQEGFSEYEKRSGRPVHANTRL